MPTTTPVVLRGEKNRFDGVAGTANRRSVGAALDTTLGSSCDTSRDEIGVVTDIGKGRGRRSCDGRDWRSATAEGGGAEGCTCLETGACRAKERSVNVCVSAMISFGEMNL